MAASPIYRIYVSNDCSERYGEKLNYSAATQHRRLTISMKILIPYNNEHPEHYLVRPFSVGHALKDTYKGFVISIHICL